MGSNLSKSQKLFFFISENLDACKTTEGKNNLIKLFNETNDEKISQAHFGKTVRSVIEKQKLNYDDFGLKGKNKLKDSSKGDALDTTLTDGSIQTPDKDINPKIISQKDIQADILKNGNNLQDAENGQMKINYTVSMVSSFWVGFYRLFQMVVPELEDFDSEEKNDLGEATLPLFQKYLQYGVMEFITPLMTIGGIFANKIKKARIKRDEMKLAEKKQDSKSKELKEEHTDTDAEKEAKKKEDEKND